MLTDLSPAPFAARPDTATVTDAAGGAVAHFFHGSTPELKARAVRDAAAYALLRNAAAVMLRHGLGVQRDGDGWIVLTAGGYMFNPVGGPGYFKGECPFAALVAAGDWLGGREKREKESENAHSDLPPPPEPCQNPVTGAIGLPACPATQEGSPMAENTGKGTDKGLKESAQGGTKGGAKGGTAKGGTKKGGTAKGGAKK